MSDHDTARTERSDALIEEIAEAMLAAVNRCNKAAYARGEEPLLMGDETMVAALGLVADIALHHEMPEEEVRDLMEGLIETLRDAWAAEDMAACPGCGAEAAAAVSLTDMKVKGHG